MEKHKYKFHDLRRIPRNQDLPEGVNALAEDAAKRLGGDDLLEQVVYMRKSKLWGDVLHVDPKRKIVDGQFVFMYGVNQRFRLNSYPKENIIIQRNIQNESVDFSKPKKRRGAEGSENQNQTEESL